MRWKGQRGVPLVPPALMHLTSTASQVAASARRRLPAWAALLAGWLALSVLVACAALPPPAEPLRVYVASIDPLPTEGLELRFAVKLRVQNPNDAPVDYHGVSLDLAVNGKALASGVSSLAGSIPRYGEAMLSVPVSISAFAALRQALGLADGALPDKLPYLLTGTLAGSAFGGTRFREEGTLAWPTTGAAR
jgi:hypothetical protein